MPTKKFEPEEFESFLKMLPAKLEGQPLRHALEVRNDSFLCEEFTELARKYNAAIVCTHSEKYPRIDEQTADFSYARLMCSQEEITTGYSQSDLDNWASKGKSMANRRPGCVYVLY